MNDLSIALLQLCSSDEPKENQKQILDYLSQLDEPGSLDVVFLPENSLYIRINKSDEHVGLTIDDEIYRPFQEFCKSNDCHMLFGSNPVRTSNGIENATVWLKPGGEIESPYTKIHLFDVDVEGHKPVRESDDFFAGSKPNIIDVKGWKIGLSICYDLRFPELFLKYAKSDVDLITIPAAFLRPTGQAHWEVLQRARAIESQAFVVSAAQAGDHRSSSGAVRESYGHSMVVDPWGRVLADLGAEPRAYQAKISKKTREKVKAQIPMANHRKL